MFPSSEVPPVAGLVLKDTMAVILELLFLDVAPVLGIGLLF